MVYGAVYARKGVTEQDIQRVDFVNDVKDSGIFFENDRQRNSLVIFAVPDRGRAGAQLYLPFHLYSIPKQAVEDLILGRLYLVVLLNPARIAAALEEEGFEVHDRSGRHDLSDESFIVTKKVQDASGNPLIMELHGLSFHILEVVYEFRPMAHVARAAKQMAQMWELAIRDKYAERRAANSAT